MNTQTMVKIANLPEILAAAQLLEKHGLLGGKDAAAVVREYVTANPDINEVMRKAEAQS